MYKPRKSITANHSWNIFLFEKFSNCFKVATYSQNNIELEPHKNVNSLSVTFCCFAASQCKFILVCFQFQIFMKSCSSAAHVRSFIFQFHKAISCTLIDIFTLIFRLSQAKIMNYNLQWKHFFFIYFKFSSSQNSISVKYVFELKKKRRKMVARNIIPNISLCKQIWYLVFHHSPSFNIQYDFRLLNGKIITILLKSTCFWSYKAHHRIAHWFQIVLFSSFILFCFVLF